MFGYIDVILEPEQEDTCSIMWMICVLFGIGILHAFLPCSFRTSIILRSSKQGRELKLSTIRIHFNSQEQSEYSFILLVIKTDFGLSETFICFATYFKNVILGQTYFTFLTLFSYLSNGNINTFLSIFVLLGLNQKMKVCSQHSSRT